jgi:hypothetical protein
MKTGASTSGTKKTGEKKGVKVVSKGVSKKVMAQAACCAPGTSSVR